MLLDGLLLFKVRALPKLTYCLSARDQSFCCESTYTIQVVDEVRDTDERQNAHINLAYDTPLHGLVVQVRDVCRANSNILLDIGLIGLLHIGGHYPGRIYNRCELGQSRVPDVFGRATAAF